MHNTHKLVRHLMVTVNNFQQKNCTFCEAILSITKTQNTDISAILILKSTCIKTLNRHLTIMRRVNDSLCPLCKEEEETSLHFLGKCCATAIICRLHFGVPFLEPRDLKQAHWITLLRFAKTTKKFQ